MTRGDPAGGAACSQWLNNSRISVALTGNTEPVSLFIFDIGFRIQKRQIQIWRHTGL